MSVQKFNWQEVSYRYLKPRMKKDLESGQTNGIEIRVLLCQESSCLSFSQGPATSVSYKTCWSSSSNLTSNVDYSASICKCKYP